jgi:hypothetical protein
VRYLNAVYGAAPIALTVVALNRPIGPCRAEHLEHVNADATLENSSGSVTTADLGVGVYEVDFGRNISNCAFVVTQGEAGLGGAPGAIVGATDRAANAEAAYVTIRSEANALVDRAFQLVVVC